MKKRSKQKKRKSQLKSKTEQKYHKPAFAALVILIPVIIYLLSFSSIIYNKPFIDKQLEKSGLFFHAKEVNSLVIDYFMDGSEGMINLDVFDEKEEQHLLDVKVLINRVFDFLFLLLVLFFALAYINWKNNSDFRKIMVYSGMITIAIPIILYFVPFGTFFTAFHNIFFAEGSWVFSPGSALVQIYPFEFWYNTSFSLFLRGFAAGWVLAVVGYFESFF
jgi:integral membrane protein (TIGR01906 family)